MADNEESLVVELEAIPAYGRTYDSVEEMLEQWHAGKDFRFVPDGPYFSIRDLELIRKMGHRVLTLYRRPDLRDGSLTFILSEHEHVELG